MVALSYDTATESVAVTATSGGASSDVVYTCPNNHDAIVTFLHVSNGMLQQQIHGQLFMEV